MSNITFLKNLPSWITSAFTNAYKNFELDNNPALDRRGEYQKMYMNAKKYFTSAERMNFKKLGFKKFEIWIVDEPSESHIDVGRLVAFNFPVQCAADSVIYTAKDQHVEKIINTSVNRATLVDQSVAEKFPYKYGIRYDYNEDYYDSYSMEHPYIVNTSVPHGGFSRTNATRIFWTCSFDSNYSYYNLVDKFQIWQ